MVQPIPPCRSQAEFNCATGGGFSAKELHFDKVLELSVDLKSLIPEWADIGTPAVLMVQEKGQKSLVGLGDLKQSNLHSCQRERWNRVRTFFLGPFKRNMDRGAVSGLNENVSRPLGFLWLPRWPSFPSPELPKGKEGNRNPDHDEGDIKNGSPDRRTRRYQH